MILIYMQVTIDYMFNTDSHSVREIEIQHGKPDIESIINRNSGETIRYYRFSKEKNNGT